MTRPKQRLLLTATLALAAGVVAGCVPPTSSSDRPLDGRGTHVTAVAPEDAPVPEGPGAPD